MSSWQSTSGIATDTDPGLPVLVQLRRASEVAEVPNWWGTHRRSLWSAAGWLSALAIVVASAVLLWELLFGHASAADPLLGRPASAVAASAVAHAAVTNPAVASSPAT